MLVDNFTVDSPNVSYTDDHITSKYDYQTTELDCRLSQDGKNFEWTVIPKTVKFEFRTKRKIPKLGLMLVGWGGNNGSTLTAGVIANSKGISWVTKEGVQLANYYGSITQSATCRIGSFKGEEVFVPLGGILPMVDPDSSLVIGGWDFNGANLSDAMARAKVLDIDLQRQLIPFMRDMTPLPGVFNEDFVASNQRERANHLLGGTKREQVEQVRRDIREFKARNNCDTVVVVWTATTERFVQLLSGVNDTKENLLKALESNHPEIPPSMLYAIACVEEGVPYINGSPQNTFVPGLIDLAMSKGSLIGGDDFKTGQTKMKSALVEFLIGAGMKPTSIVSYNHLGNNDGLNLSLPHTFRSKEISKSGVVEDMVNSNELLFPQGREGAGGGKGGHPDHVVVIKYVPSVGDSKRAMDEFVSEIFLGGKSTIAIHNTCEDSLLAAPVILDLALLAELCTRVEVRREGEEEFRSLHPVASILSYLTKAPLVPPGTPIVNALSKQRSMLENILKACVGLPPENHMLLEQKLFLNGTHATDISVSTSSTSGL